MQLNENFHSTAYLSIHRLCSKNPNKNPLTCRQNSNMQTTFWQKEIILGVRRGWVAAALGIYFAFYLSYVVTLTMNEFAYAKKTYNELLYYYFVSQAIDYTYKLLLTLPLCYLYFRLIAHWHIISKIVLHIFTMIIFVLAWQKLF